MSKLNVSCTSDITDGSPPPSALAYSWISRLGRARCTSSHSVVKDDSVHCRFTSHPFGGDPPQRTPLSQVGLGDPPDRPPLPPLQGTPHWDRGTGPG